MLGRYKKFFFIVFAAFCAFAIFALFLVFFKKEPSNTYKLVSENNVAHITENGKRICQRMVYVTKGSTSEELGESFQDFKFEFTAPYDVEKCALHFRFNKQNLKVYIAQIELKNLTTGKTERSLDLSGTLPDKNMKYWCKGFGKKQLPLTLQNQTENGKKFLLLDIKKPKADEMDGFHLYYKCPPVRKNNMFCSITKMPAELFRYAAKLANAPIYSSTGVAVYRNGNFISVCAAKDGVYKIDLFDTYKVCDVFENKEIAQTNSLTLTLKKGDIKFYMQKK